MISDIMKILPTVYIQFHNGNWTEWSVILSEIICMILKLDKHAVWVQFEITSMISDQNCTTQSSNTTFIITAILKSQNSVSINIYLTK